MDNILELLNTACGTDNISYDTNLVNLNMDSITFIKLIIAIETEFNVEFNDDALLIEKYETVKDMNDYVLSLDNTILRDTEDL